MRRKDKTFSRIVINNVQRERKSLSRYACKSHQGNRKDPGREKIPDRKNLRPVFFHDTDKIMHSHSYCRYIDKTQVFFLFENDHITRRVLHVQLVSKIGRVIGRCLRLNEDLIEAISLGHDLGHVPYAHDGEKILSKLCEDNGIGYFCHNAQSVRLLTEIEERGKGLNLSLQVLDGILAHNGEIPSREYKPNRDKTWEDFEEEYRKCFAEKDYDKKLVPMTLEGCVVRVSDIIAYIGRDIEDAILLGVIEGFKEVPKEIRATLGNSNDKIINNIVLDLVKNSYDKDRLIFTDNVFKALKDLLKFNQEKIYSNPYINRERFKLEHMFKELFEHYLKCIKRHSQGSPICNFLADMDDIYRHNTSDKRAVIDFIAGMTDDFFNNQYRQLFVPVSYGYSL